MRALKGEEFMGVSAMELKIGAIPFGVYYTEGKDVYLTETAVNTFKALVPSDSLSLYVFDRLESINDVILSIGTIGFGGDPNVVIVKDSEYKISDGERKQLESLTVNDGYVLFVNPKYLSAKEKKNFTAVDCDKPRKFDCLKYAEKLAGDGADRSAVNKLIEYADGDLARIKLELEKLESYCDGRRATVADVEEIVSKDAELQIFHFVSALTEGNKATALNMLDKLKRRGEAPSFMLASLVGQYRRILHASLSPKTDAELAELLKVKEYAVKKARETRKMSKAKLRGVLKMLVGYELKFKSGEISEQTAFDAAISRLIGGEI